MSKSYLASPSLSEENKTLKSENRRLRERLFELYSQINSLSKIADDHEIPKPPEITTQAISMKKSASAMNSSPFVKTEGIILPGGAIYSAAASPKSTHVALASLSGSVTILTSSLKPSTVLNGHSLACRDVYWGSAGLVSCSFDKTIKVWDVETSSLQREIQTGGLAHAICGSDDNPNTLFSASGTQVVWIDKRRETPITIETESRTTAVAVYKDMIIYGGYDGMLNIADRRSLHMGNLNTIDLGGGAISSISKAISDGRCVITTSKSSPYLLAIEDQDSLCALNYEIPNRFGCRADISEQSLIFNNNFATVCGGRMAAFATGYNESTPLEEVSGFDYGAIFIASMAQKILSYSEDGVVSTWSYVRT